MMIKSQWMKLDIKYLIQSNFVFFLTFSVVYISYFMMIIIVCALNEIVFIDI